MHRDLGLQEIIDRQRLRSPGPIWICGGVEVKSCAGRLDNSPAGVRGEQKIASIWVETTMRGDEYVSIALCRVEI